MARTELTPGRSALAILAAMALGAPAAGAQAQAAPRSLTWSTFMRAGPGNQYAALDEIEHGVSVEVLGCDGGWCRIQTGRITGYIDQEALTLPKVPAGSAPPAATPNCFVAGQVSYPGAAPTRFCETAPRAAR